MSTTTPGTQRLPLTVAAGIAAKITRCLEPGCERIEVVGSIRRRCTTVGDVELLVIPRPHPHPRKASRPRAGAPSLFGAAEPSIGDVNTYLDVELEKLLQQNKLAWGGRSCNGPRQKRLEIVAWPGVYLELFIVSAETWGVQQLIRTGPAAFAHQAVTWAGQVTGGPEGMRGLPGLLPRNMKVQAGRLWKVESGTYHPLPTPTDREVFAALGQPYREPWER